MGMPWHLSVARSRHLPLPAGFIEPCRPTLVAFPPTGLGWLHEMKHDGFRILARKQGERVDVWSRRGILFNDRFPNIAEAVGALPVRDALIDGEAVTPGRPFRLRRPAHQGGRRASVVRRLRPAQPRGRRFSRAPAGGAARRACAASSWRRRRPVQ
jgi:ATP-dependent DNA ligase